MEKRGTNFREIILKMTNAEKQINLIKKKVIKGKGGGGGVIKKTV
jgi:hypothetical protein